MPEPAANLVAVGASAGGVEALTTLVAGLPEGLDAAVALERLAGAVADAVVHLSKEVGMSDNGRDEMSLETAYATRDATTLEPRGEPSAFACPACGGVLRELDDGRDLPRFRCRVGHAFSAEGTIDAEGAAVETALWAALRALQERAQLSSRLAGRMERAGAEKSRRRFEELAREAREQAETIRRVLAGSGARED